MLEYEQVFEKVIVILVLYVQSDEQQNKLLRVCVGDDQVIVFFSMMPGGVSWISSPAFKKQ